MSRLFHSSSLIFKVIFVTTLIVMIAISFITWLDIRLYEAHIQRTIYDKTKIISEFIEYNVIRAMEKGRHFDIHRILKNFSNYRGIWKINLFKPDGKIVASTHEDELNRNVENIDFFLENSHFIREETVRDMNGKMQRVGVYYFVNPIINKRECFQCHSQENKYLGILTVANSLKDMDEELSRVKRDSIILAGVTIVSLCMALALLFLKFMNVPITKLTEVMRKVEEGDLTARVDLGSRDEMGRLAENLNMMIEKLHFAKKDAEQYHRELVQRADRMASIGELASGIAHEIRNPLAGIQGALQILGEDFARDDSRREVTDEIQKQIFKLECFVRGLLNYAKPVPTHYLPIDLNELVDKVVSFLMMQTKKSEDLKIEKKFYSPLPKVMVDPNSMEQAFLNIMLNAQKAMPKGGTFTISTHLLDQEGEDKKKVKKVQVLFEDTGVGIPSKNLTKIFNPFFTTRSDGTGLGLSITKNIVEQHGGTIEVESQINVGSKFTITLPVGKGG